jgi:hypothetical protein
MCLVATLIIGLVLSRVQKSIRVKIPGNRAANVPCLGGNNERTSQPQPVETEDRLKSTSPYEIRVFVYSHPQTHLKDIWDRLGLHSQNFGKQHGPLESIFFETCMHCEAEVFEFDLDDEPGKEVLLRVADRLQEACRYVIFKEPDAGKPTEGWKVLGHIDHDFGRYQMPQHYFFVGGGQAWLVVTVQEGSGVGFALYYDRVFRIDHDRLKEELVFPSDGHLSTITWVPSLQFSSRILDYERGSKMEKVVVYFFSVYSADNLFTWTKKQSAIFTRAPNMNGFSFDSRKSEISRPELRLLFELSGAGYEDLLKYNYKELAKVAEDGNLGKKDWIHRFLNECKPSPENKRLRRMLK